MGQAARKRECVARDQVMNEIADDKREGPSERYDLLVLSGVDVQRQGGVDWFLHAPRRRSLWEDRTRTMTLVPPNHTPAKTGPGHFIWPTPAPPQATPYDCNDLEYAQQRNAGVHASRRHFLAWRQRTRQTRRVTSGREVATGWALRPASRWRWYTTASASSIA
jgi:hypothetical protein